jgi:hypothetical protein
LRIDADHGPSAAPERLATLDAMAVLARHIGSPVHVVLPREAGVVQHAREAGRRVGVEVSADLMPFTVRVRFEHRPGGARR